MHRIHRVGHAMLLLLLSFAAPSLAALEFDLATDFSTVTNPFGPWTLWRAPGAPFPTCQPDYFQDGTNVRAWADQPFALQMHVPVWGPGPEGTGSVWTHGAEFDRTGSAVTSAVWTSPDDGALTIGGAIWQVGTYSRWMRWQLWHEGTLLTGGDLCSNGTYTSDQPWNFAAGSGGPAALTCDVLAGERLELRLTSLSESGNLGESLGLRLHLSLDTTSAAPLPDPRAAGASARLLPPRPNPFNPCTQLRVEVARAGAVRLAVFDLAGRRVRALFADTAASPGTLTATWDGRDDAGRACPSGRYVARLACDGGGDAVGLMLVR